MATLLTSLLEQAERRKAEARRVLGELADAEAAGQSKPSDAAKLERALTDAGETLADFEARVSECRRLADLRTQAKDAEALMETAVKARQKLDAFDAESRGLEKTREARRWELQSEAQTASSRAATAQQAADDLATVESEP